ncbi:hypothetical protein niasHT_024122 [Heterodera trifolii]|uniref:Glutathione synthetase n=1 Tax=Heterodera trifolii TaxID=157864 RepID=A0ABD2KQQ5_9BILA
MNNIFKTFIFTAISFIAILLLNFVHVEANDDDKKGNEEDEHDIQALVDDAIDWAHHIGLIKRCLKHMAKSDVAEFVPFSLFPSPIPRKCFTKAKELQTAMNLLYFRISQDYDFLRETLQQVAETNAIIRDQLDILRQVQEEGGVKQQYSFIMGRSDYMCHVNDNETDGQNYALKQIEMNIGAIGGYGRATRATNLHRRTMAKSGANFSPDAMPANNSEGIIVDSLYLAWQKFGDPNALLLIVVGQAYQTFEQKQVEYLLLEKSNKQIKIVQLSLKDCDEKLVLDENDFSLRLEGKLIGVVYFRSIIVVPKPEQISARRKIERSTAIKCPNVAMELASSKKIQQVLSLPGVVERFLPNAEDEGTVAAIRSTFAGLWALDREDVDSNRIIEDAIKNPDNYVLKPSEEGGGNNFWGQKITEKLQTFTKQQLSAYILMQRLKPLKIKNYLVRPHKRPVKLVEAVSELSIFGYLIAHGDTVLENVSDGHMVRTKQEHITEGGIGAGGGVHDSPYLF